MGGQVTLTAEVVRARLKALEHLLDDLDAQLSPLSLVRRRQGAGMWTSVPACATFADTYHATLESLDGSLREIRRKVTTLQENLARSAKTLAKTDQDISDRLTALARRLAEGSPATTGHLHPLRPGPAHHHNRTRCRTHVHPNTDTDTDTGTRHPHLHLHLHLHLHPHLHLRLHLRPHRPRRRRVGARRGEAIPASGGPVAGTVTGTVTGTVVLAVACLTLAAPLAGATDPTDDGLWYYTVTGVADVHATGTTGQGITIAVIDGPINPDVPDLVGTNLLTRTDSFCDTDGDGTPDPAITTTEDAEHATGMVSLILGTGVGTAGRSAPAESPQAPPSTTTPTRPPATGATWARPAGSRWRSTKRSPTGPTSSACPSAPTAGLGRAGCPGPSRAGRHGPGIRVEPRGWHRPGLAGVGERGDLGGGR